MLPLIIYKFIQTTAEHFQGKRTAAALTTQKHSLQAVQKPVAYPVLRRTAAKHRPAAVKNGKMLMELCAGLWKIRY